MRKSVTRVLVGTLLILLVPLVAMQVTDEVNWDTVDFAVAAVLLAGTGAILEWIFARTESMGRRALGTFAVVTAFALIWAELAVGLIQI